MSTRSAPQHPEPHTQPGLSFSLTDAVYTSNPLLPLPLLLPLLLLLLVPLALLVVYVLCAAEDVWRVLMPPPDGYEDGTVNFLSIAQLQFGFAQLQELGGIKVGGLQALVGWCVQHVSVSLSLGSAWSSPHFITRGERRAGQGGDVRLQQHQIRQQHTCQQCSRGRWAPIATVCVSLNTGIQL